MIKNFILMQLVSIEEIKIVLLLICYAVKCIINNPYDGMRYRANYMEDCNALIKDSRAFRYLLLHPEFTGGTKYDVTLNYLDYLDDLQNRIRG